MRVRELISVAVDLFDQPDLDQIFRAVNNTIRDINGVFRGLHQTKTAFHENFLYNNYLFHSSLLPGDVRVEAIGTTVIGNDTLFGNNLIVGDYIIIAGHIRIVANIVSPTEITVNENLPEISSTTYRKVLDFNKIILTGHEKTILNVIINGAPYKQIQPETFLIAYGDDKIYSRPALNEIYINHLPDDPTIEIEALFAIPRVTGKEDEIEFPYAWESLLTNGLLHYISNIPAYAGREKQGYGDNYYAMLNDFAANTNVSLMTDYYAWNYAKAEKD